MSLGLDHFGDPRRDLRHISRLQNEPEALEHLILNLLTYALELEGRVSVVEWERGSDGLKSQGYNFVDLFAHVSDDLKKRALLLQQWILEEQGGSFVLISTPRDNNVDNEGEGYSMAYIYCVEGDRVKQLCLRVDSVDQLEACGLRFDKLVYKLDLSADEVIKNYSGGAFETVRQVEEFFKTKKEEFGGKLEKYLLEDQESYVKLCETIRSVMQEGGIDFGSNPQDWVLIVERTLHALSTDSVHSVNLESARLFDSSLPLLNEASTSHFSANMVQGGFFALSNEFARLFRDVAIQAHGNDVVGFTDKDYVESETRVGRVPASESMMPPHANRSDMPDASQFADRDDTRQLKRSYNLDDGSFGQDHPLQDHFLNAQPSSRGFGGTLGLEPVMLQNPDRYKSAHSAREGDVGYVFNPDKSLLEVQISGLSTNGQKWGEVVSYESEEFSAPLTVGTKYFGYRNPKYKSDPESKIKTGRAANSPVAAVVSNRFKISEERRLQSSKWQHSETTLLHRAKLRDSRVGDSNDVANNRESDLENRVMRSLRWPLNVRVRVQSKNIRELKRNLSEGFRTLKTSRILLLHDTDKRGGSLHDRYVEGVRSLQARFKRELATRGYVTTKSRFEHFFRKAVIQVSSPVASRRLIMPRIVVSRQTSPFINRNSHLRNARLNSTRLSILWQIQKSVTWQIVRMNTRSEKYADKPHQNQLNGVLKRAFILAHNFHNRVLKISLFEAIFRLKRSIRQIRVDSKSSKHRDQPESTDVFLRRKINIHLRLPRKARLAFRSDLKIRRTIRKAGRLSYLPALCRKKKFPEVISRVLNRSRKFLRLMLGKQRTKVQSAGFFEKTVFGLEEKLAKRSMTKRLMTQRLLYKFAAGQLGVIRFTGVKYVNFLTRRGQVSSDWSVILFLLWLKGSKLRRKVVRFYKLVLTQRGKLIMKSFARKLQVALQPKRSFKFSKNSDMARKPMKLTFNLPKKASKSKVANKPSSSLYIVFQQDK